MNLGILLRERHDGLITLGTHEESRAIAFQTGSPVTPAEAGSPEAEKQANL